MIQEKNVAFIPSIKTFIILSVKNLLFIVLFELIGSSNMP